MGLGCEEMRLMGFLPRAVAVESSKVGGVGYFLRALQQRQSAESFLQSFFQSFLIEVQRAVIDVLRDKE